MFKDLHKHHGLNTAARWVSGSSKRTRISTLMKTVGWLNVKEQILSATMTQTWKIVKWSRPLRLRNKWTIGDNLQITTNGPRLLFLRSCFRWRAPRQWNELPPSLRDDDSISRFKRRLRRHILDGRDRDPGDLSGSQDQDQQD